MKFTFLMITFLISLSLQHIEGKSISFDDLRTENTANPYLNQEVELRGFLYQNQDKKEWVLCSMPNLKSCCVHKANSFPIYLMDFHPSEPIHNAVEVQGILKKKQSKFYLEKTRFILPYTNPFYFIFLALSSLGIIGFIYRLGTQFYKK
jgi:hypothetical protein